MPPTPLVGEFSGFGRNGRPGSRGSRESARLKRGACSEGTRRKPDTDGRANQLGFARRRSKESAATDKYEFAANSRRPFPGGDAPRYFVWVEGLRANDAQPFPPPTPRSCGQ